MPCGTHQYESDLGMSCFSKPGYTISPYPSKSCMGNSKSFVFPDIISNIVHFATASWKWTSVCLLYTHFFSEAFLLLNEVWFGVLSHTESNASKLNIGFMCEKFYEAYDILRRQRKQLPSHHCRREGRGEIQLWWKRHLAIHTPASSLRNK